MDLQGINCLSSRARSQVTVLGPPLLPSPRPHTRLGRLYDGFFATPYEPYVTLKTYSNTQKTKDEGLVGRKELEEGQLDHGGLDRSSAWAHGKFAWPNAPGTWQFPS